MEKNGLEDKHMEEISERVKEKEKDRGATKSRFGFRGWRKTPKDRKTGRGIKQSTSSQSDEIISEDARDS